jgi:DNA-binding SARP family transcriptional activator
VLTRGRRTALPRHRTLRALLDWSYHLLAPAERALLAQLSVFRGAFTFDAVEAVCGEAVPDALGALGRLVELSLVDVREDDGETRYRLLETVRQYGLARLAEAPDAGRAVRARHAAWVAALAAAAEPHFWSPARVRTMTRVARDLDEIRAALAWATAPDGDALLGVRVAGALGWMLGTWLPWSEGYGWLQAAVTAGERAGLGGPDRPVPVRLAHARPAMFLSHTFNRAGDPRGALAAAGRLASVLESVARDLAAAGVDPSGNATPGPPPAAASDPTAVLPARATTGAAVDARRAPELTDELDEWRRALWFAECAVHDTFAESLLQLGDAEGAVRHADAALAAAVRTGHAWYAGLERARYAAVLSTVGRHVEAAAEYAASAAAYRALGERFMLSFCLQGMAANALAMGELAAAAAHAGESVAVLRDEPDMWMVSSALDTLAAATAAASAGAAVPAGTAARLLGAAAALRERCGAGVIDLNRERHAATVATVREALGDAWMEHHRQGAALDLAGAFALAAAVDRGAVEVVPPTPAGPAPTRGAAPLHAEVTPATDRLAPQVVATRDLAPDGLTVHVLAFGPLLVTRGGVTVPPSELTPAKVRELLLYLALHPEGRTKEQAALALWPDATPAQVRNAFHVTLHQLRRALGRKAAVTFDGGAYALARDVAPRAGASAAAPADAEAAVVRCDVDAVLAAADAVRAADRAADRARARRADGVAAAGADAAALAAWREALGLAARGALGEGEDAGEWLAAPAARVGAAWAEAMEALARLHARGDAPAAAASVLEALVAAEPLREGPHRMLMAAYVTAGEPARALAHYDALAARLAREVGAAPGRATRALAEAIRGGSGRTL